MTQEYLQHLAQEALELRRDSQGIELGMMDEPAKGLADYPARVVRLCDSFLAMLVVLLSHNHECTRFIIKDMETSETMRCMDCGRVEQRRGQ